MSSLDLYKSRLKVLGNTAGMNRKTQSDVIMEQTWNNDIQTRTCYLYDYFHDRDSDKLRGYDPSTDVNKFAISCKLFFWKAVSHSEIDILCCAFTTEDRAIRSIAILFISLLLKCKIAVVNLKWT